MIRIHPIENAARAESYYAKSDSGYYLEGGGLQSEWGGRAAAMLGLSGTPDYEHFKRLIRGLDPHTGAQLTAKLIDARVPGWDITMSVPKGVTTLLELGDTRVQGVIWAAARETMAEVEAMAATRKRKGGAQEDRTTGNLVWYAVEHAETRPTKEDNMPDWDRHIHFVAMNLTWDATERQWKAAKVRPIMEDRKWLDRRFDARVASKLTDLGYQIETKWKSDGAAGKKFFSWDVQGIPSTVIKKFSRRTGEVERLADELGVTSATGKDKLGATSRLHKRQDQTLADFRCYWDGRVTPEEGREIAATIKRAILGQNPKPEPQIGQAMAWSIQHHFERRSVVPLKELEITALERSMGAVWPEQLQRAANAQGLLVRDGLATTREVLQEEQRIIAFARQGRGTLRPLRAGDDDASLLAGLSAEQRAAVQFVWNSSDRMTLIRGGSGVGKTRMMRSAVAGIDRPVAVLAPSADASRRTLREEGFPEANTVAHFLRNPQAQSSARGGVIWVDEAGLLPIRDLRQVVDIAKSLEARVVLQGDARQHKAVPRHGNMLDVLQTHAGLPLAELKDIRRQSGRYKDAVAAIQQGDLAGGFDIFGELGWIKQTTRDSHVSEVAQSYVECLDAGKEALLVCPTHREGRAISDDVRERLKERGAIGQDEREFTRLEPLNWTEPERGEAARYEDGEIVVQFHHHTGRFKAGQRATVYPEGAAAEHFNVFSSDSLKIATGDRLRVTVGGKTKDGHRIDNGYACQVAGFTPQGDIRLTNGWVLDKDFGHWSHDYVRTSYAAQGRTVPRVLVAMGSGSLGAIHAEQAYVSVSRGREQATVFSDLAPAMLRAAIRRHDERQSATELVGAGARGAMIRTKSLLQQRAFAFTKKVQALYRQLRDKAALSINERTKTQELEHGLTR